MTKRAIIRVVGIFLLSFFDDVLLGSDERAFRLHQLVNAVQQIKINLLRNDDVQEVISFLIRFADSYHI